MKSTIFTKATQLLIVVGIPMITACGGKEEDEEMMNSTNRNDSSSCKKTSPEKADEQVVAIYRKALKESVELSKDKPDAASVEKTFNTSLENYQNQHLKIGQHVVTMNSQQKAVVESAVNKEYLNMQINEQGSQRVICRIFQADFRLS